MIWPLIYSLYNTSLLSVISNHPGIECHFYVDDTQIYISFAPELTSLALSTTESSIKDVFLCMTQNKLPIDPNKTEYLLFKPNNVNLPINTINLGSNITSLSDSSKNLHVIFQTNTFLDKHVSSIVKSCFL